MGGLHTQERGDRQDGWEGLKTDSRHGALGVTEIAWAPTELVGIHVIKE